MIIPTMIRTVSRTSVATIDRCIAIHSYSLNILSFSVFSEANRFVLFLKRNSYISNTTLFSI